MRVRRPVALEDLVREQRLERSPLETLLLELGLGPRRAVLPFISASVWAKKLASSLA